MGRVSDAKLWGITIPASGSKDFSQLSRRHKTGDVWLLSKICTTKLYRVTGIIDYYIHPCSSDGIILIIWSQILSPKCISTHYVSDILSIHASGMDLEEYELDSENLLKRRVPRSVDVGNNFQSLECELLCKLNRDIV